MSISLATTVIITQANFYELCHSFRVLNQVFIAEVAELSVY